VTIEKRVKNLERRLSLTRWLLVLVFLIFVGGNTWKSKTIIPVVEAQQVDNDQKVIRSNTFILEDKDGKIRGIWGSSNEGNPVLQLYDKNVALPVQALAWIRSETKLRRDSCY